MKRVFLFSILSLAFAFAVNGQDKKKQDQETIKKMCGCYEVGFNFAETFQYSNDSAYVPSKVKHDKGLEWVQLVEDDSDKIVMQHLLIVGRPDAQKVIKHWRQDWLFENTELYTYHADNTWKYNMLPKEDVRGQWTQKVFQVDDSPRYEGTASWVHVDGQSYWENTTDAPLPRREYTKRSDYNVTLRNNKHAITSEGWIHDQDNKKIIRKNGLKDVVLAEEKGFNTYTKVPDSRCKAAQDWWKENEKDWALVRAKWDKVFAQNQDLRLNAKVNDKPLYAHLFDKDFVKTEESIAKTIDTFIAK
ncbi:DUF6607 family protein [Flagellimonas meridianipacifica]|uniref:DKNYY family protein n=1 Tax=Flagellimonas meridianipacifica TaxID=1080225 RepID=A0A2T0MEQ2_9FLAO|nr:DUF6607 family protein [Allomuricauda pacifica]PRX56044.1 hypothetical protein CLV81_0032 [Allomuricauda pacifica]